MPLPRALAAAHAPEFLATLQAEWPESHWPLEAFLARGGWPESPRLALRALRNEFDRLVCSLTVTFTEQCPAACPASATPETRVGHFTLEIHKPAGQSLVSIEQ